MGTALVLFATYLYTGPDRKRGRPPPINIVSYEKTTIDPTSTPRTTDRLEVPNLFEGAKSLGLSTSRPSSPLRHHIRGSSAKDKARDE
jgi:solute carrier family 35 (UDP-sugar transporter), member A1/2/3